jgi:hypothetical protein
LCDEWNKIMAKSSKLRVMISSRCNDFFPTGQTKLRLSDIRKALKVELEKLEIFGKRVLEVWINEEAPPMAGTWDSWDVCLEAIKDSDIVIAIANGHAGWAQTGGDIGICHAELATALAQSPAKVRIVALPNVAIGRGDEGERNRRFQQYLAAQNLFRGGAAQTVDDCVQRTKEA